jgi:hypothetical protein
VNAVSSAAAETHTLRCRLNLCTCRLIVHVVASPDSVSSKKKQVSTIQVYITSQT